MVIIEERFQIWKNGKYTERDVGVFYAETCKDPRIRIQRLHDDYPESKGYFLKPIGIFREVTKES